MPFIDGVSGYGEGIYNALTNLISGRINSEEHGYNSPADEVEDNVQVTAYRTVVVCGEPFRKSKFILVPEMNDFYTDAQLNTVYHSADEYRNAIDKYGFIYKSVKFDNADTPQKLFDYAKDWIKNNYHGGLTSFSITALDMRIAGRTDLQKITVGKRVKIIYRDPSTGKKANQTLTCISAEYNLQNPDKNNYKIGIPDVALNKVYGEAKKSKKGGGGGGGQTSDETDSETDTEVEGLNDTEDELNRILDHKSWAHLFSGNNTDEEDGFDFSQLLTPGERDPTNNTTFAMAADAFRSTLIDVNKLTARKVTGEYLNATGGVDTKKLSSETSNTGRTNAESIDVLKNSTFGSNVTVGNILTTKGLTIDGKSFKVGVEGGSPVIWINNRKYTLTTE